MSPLNRLLGKDKLPGKATKKKQKKGGK